MSIRARADLKAVAQRVHAEFGGEGDVITRAQIEAAIAANAKEPIGSRSFSEEEYACLLRLRSQAFKAPDGKIRLA